MGNLFERTKGFRRLLIAMPVLVVVLLIINFFYIRNYNSKVCVSQGCADTESLYLNLDSRTDSTSTWMKRDFDLNGTKVDLNARTFDGVITNQSPYTIADFSFVLNIQSDCYINNAWCGTVEIHQHVGTADEKVQTLDLRNYDLEGITLDYSYDGDLLIPLSRGDYIVYYASTADKEVPMNKESNLTMGMIFYYLTLPDLSDYTLQYQYGRTFRESGLFTASLVLLAVWGFLMIEYGISLYIYRTARRELELKKSGIQIMSELYAIIYILDLQKDELTPVSASEEAEKLRPRNMTANEQLHNMFEWDSTDTFKATMQEFCDLTTLADRFGSRNTLVREFISKQYGWCRIRFFAMERDEAGKVTKVLFTIQVIDEEKAEMEEFSNRVSLAEQANRTKTTFLANVSQEIKAPIGDILQLDAKICSESEDAQVRKDAEGIDGTGKLVLTLLDGILDYSRFENSGLALTEAEYSLHALMEELQKMFGPKIGAKSLELKTDCTAGLPDRLIGDKQRLEEALVHLLTNAVKFTDAGSIQISLYGKDMGDRVHLLFSVKDSGCGLDSDRRRQLSDSFAADGDKTNAFSYNSIGLNLVTELLRLMDSELHIISSPDEGTELYFEIEQPIAGGPAGGEET